MLKLDIEGAEWELLMQTSSEELAKVQQVSVELHLELAGRWTIDALVDHLGKAGIVTTVDNRHRLRPELWGARL
jgi:hypothetical protein